jgi:hypothetical protein
MSFPVPDARARGNGGMLVGKGCSAPTPMSCVRFREFVQTKGVRSFDANDSKSFLQLLPGPRDQDGLLDSVRFWKHRIEETDNTTFTVGVIYGPSGCGKSSLVKAGLLPRLAKRIISVYVEATPDETEAGLLNERRRKLATLPANLNLKQTIGALRQGPGLRAEQKVVVVIDQFQRQPIFELLPIRPDDSRFLEDLIEHDPSFRDLVEQGRAEIRGGSVSPIESVRERLLGLED